jgi:hypothetical protein
VTIWNTPPEITEAFLAEHHDYVMVDVFHRIKARLLYPCGCRKPCGCEDLRARVVLTLNIGLYNQIEDCHQDQSLLSALKHFLQIPDDRFLRRHLERIYAPDFIVGEFQKKEAANHFRIVDRLVWALLRLGATYKKARYYRKPFTSLNEAVGIILGAGPLKSKRGEGKEAYLCGEKGYIAHFKTYKAVCHFIAAFKIVDPAGEYLGFGLTEGAQILRFFQYAHKLKTELMALELRHRKEKNLFTQGSLIPLPDWVESDDIDITIEPFADRLQTLNRKSSQTP